MSETRSQSVAEQVIASLKFAIEAFEKEKASFVEQFDINPEYALVEKTRRVINAQERMLRALAVMRMIENPDEEHRVTLLQALERVARGLLREQTENFYVRMSTSPAFNAAELYKSETRAKVLTEFCSHIRRLGGVQPRMDA